MTYQPKACEKCGKTYTPSNGNQKRCPECAKVKLTPADAPAPGQVPAPPSPLALRVWDLDRQHLRLHSFNAAPSKPPAWWIASAFDTPAGGWPYSEPLVAECKAAGRHEPHEPDECDVKGCLHDGRIPDPACKCGVYATRSLTVVSDYLRAARAPVLGVVELGGRVIMAEPGRPGYARAEYARVAAVLLIDPGLTVDHRTLGRLAEAYHVPALVPHSVNPDDYRGRIAVTTGVGEEADDFLRGLTEEDSG